MTAPSTTPPPAPTGSPAKQPPPSAARRLDESISVSRPGAWLALAAVGVLVAVAVVAALTLRVPQVATAPATVTFPGGRMVVAAGSAGTVQQLSVTVGATVAAGADVATVRRPDGGVTAVVAPHAGTVLAVPVLVGQAVAVGEEIAELVIASGGSAASVVAFVAVEQAAEFPGGSHVDVLLGGRVLHGTVESVSRERIPLEAMADVLGGPGLAQAAFERAGGAPVAVTVSIDATGLDVPDGTAVTLRRVVSDPTLWDVVLGGGR